MTGLFRRKPEINPIEVRREINNLWKFRKELLKKNEQIMKKADENLDSEFNEERKTEYNNNKYEIENLGNEINMNFSKLDEDQEKKLPQEILNHKRLL